MDVLENPFVRLNYFIDATALCSQADASGFDIHAAWPSYRDTLDVYWHKKILSRSDKLDRVMEHLRRSRLSFLAGQKLYLAGEIDTVNSIASSLEGLTRDIDALIDEPFGENLKSTISHLTRIRQAIKTTSILADDAVSIDSFDNTLASFLEIFEGYRAARCRRRHFVDAIESLFHQGVGTSGPFPRSAKALGLFTGGRHELTIGIGIVGVGMVGQMCHLANFVNLPGCRVVAVADLRPDLAAAAAAKFSVPRIYRTHTDLLNDIDVTGVVVVTRRPATGPIVLDALSSGRHVLSEKPMAYTSAQASTLVRAARQRNLIYSIGYMKRHDAGVARAMDLLERLRADGSLGSIIGARGWCFAGETGRENDNFVMTREARPDGLELWPDGPSWMPSAMRPGYDTFLNVFSHIINLARYMLGANPALTQSKILSLTSATISLDFSGIPCVLELANEPTGTWREGLAIEFERGVLTIEMPPPFADGMEASVILNDSELPRKKTWAFRRTGRGLCSGYLRGYTATGARQRLRHRHHPRRGGLESARNWLIVASANGLQGLLRRL